VRRIGEDEAESEEQSGSYGYVGCKFDVTFRMLTAVDGNVVGCGLEFDEIRALRPKSNADAAKRMIAGALGDVRFAPRSSHEDKRKKAAQG